MVCEFEVAEEAECVLEKTLDTEGVELGLGALEGVRDRERSEVWEGEEEGDAQKVAAEVGVPVTEEKYD